LRSGKELADEPTCTGCPKDQFVGMHVDRLTRAQLLSLARSKDRSVSGHGSVCSLRRAHRAGLAVVSRPRRPRPLRLPRPSWRQRQPRRAREQDLARVV